MTKTRNLPTFRRRDAMAVIRNDRWKPVFFGAGLLAAGALLSQLRPSALDMPNPSPLRDRRGSAGKVADTAQDGIDAIAPDNLVSKLGASLAIAGAAMIAARVMDEVTARRS